MGVFPQGPPCPHFRGGAPVLPNFGGSIYVYTRTTKFDVVTHMGGACFRWSAMPLHIDLGVTLDSELTLQRHFNKVASACFYHIRRLKKICRLLGPDVATSLVSAFLLSRLDYCNAILAGFPKTTIAPLQHAQNAAARLVARLDLVTTSVMPCTICTGSLYSIASLTSSAYLCILLTIIGRHPTWSTVSPPQPVSVTVDDFGPQAVNTTSSRDHDSNLASAASPLQVRQLGTAFHQFKN